ncbi:importin-alpha export receptor [Pichia californica]|uniref:Importin-alpha export receptor n=1 Tax=Pichia californica TaxID=460514 RepID=A0A9P6WK19_9ASCO|nr:importin-alpha export receptor [[Candida] californica]KAG0688590.1 importin-alpha export receptor [[Candida] californica]
MSDIGSIVQVLEQSLNPSTAKNAEGILKGFESQVGFPITLLHVVANSNTPISVRLAGALYFKNLVKRKWIDENGQYQISKQDVDMIKTEIVSLMIVLPDSLQIQIGEAISLIAESEFPDMWSGLIDELVSKLTLDDLVANKGVLKVAHSIFKRWRPLFRSDELFIEIKMVLDKFAVPFLEMLKTIDILIDQNLQDSTKLKLLLENLLLLVKIYYDLNCQDIPEFFEDHINEGLTILLKYLKFHSTLLEDPNEDDEIDPVIEVKINICELIQLYTTRYEEEYKKYIEISIQIIWDLLNNVSNQQKNDILVSKALQYMTCVVNLSSYNTLFNNEESINQITEKIILPNIKLREADLEMFEDDPIEYTRRDLEGSDVDSRRRSTTEFLRALKESNENMVTNIMMSYINHYLKSYSENPSGNWKEKDIAIYLFCAIASKGVITNSGITSTNLLIDVIKFFSEFIYPDLVGNVSNPILKVDSIKYIYIFRNQLTKEQLIETLPLLTSNFNDDNYVVYTYTSITIEKILSLRNPTNHQQMLFNKNDLSVDVLNNLLMNLFKLIFKMGSTPEKLSENEFLMKCVMRILLISEDSNSQSILQIIEELIKIVEIISKNPSNPKFSHYTFESICIILKYYQTAIKDFYSVLKNTLFGILGQDIQEFIPYSFQILSFVLESYPINEDLPIEYEQLIKPLCSPQVWEFKGNIPAIKRLLSAIISFKPSLFNNQSNITPILGIYQKLISSKSNDILGFELLECIMINIDINDLKQFLNEIFIILLTRLKSFKTEKFVKRFIIFLSKLSSLELNPNLNKNKWNSTIIIKVFEGIQPGLFIQILNNFILPNINKFNNLTDKKILVVGLTNLIVENYREINSNEILQILSELLKLLNSDSIKNYKTIDENMELMAEFDHDDFAFGSSFNRLNTIQLKPLDPINNNIKDKNMLIEFFKIKLQSIDSQYFHGIIQQLDPECSAIVHSLIM